MVKKFTWTENDEAHYAYYGDEELGFIEFYKSWKKWVWNQNEDIIMSIDCLEKVCKKLWELKKHNILVKQDALKGEDDGNK